MEYIPVDDDEPGAPVAEAVPDGPMAADPAWLDEVEAALADVERALARLDDGSYGTCETCGGPIDAAAIEADPTVRLCAAHLPLALP